MEINWQHPFQLAGELFLLVFGWTLVGIVGLFALAIVVGIIKAVVNIFKKKPSAEDSTESIENYLKSV
jgi:Na+-transporting methylmalonyl-CoA/oxaloacetate decarboxylase gamma subunit